MNLRSLMENRELKHATFSTHEGSANGFRTFRSPPTFWGARDQPEPGSFFPRIKDTGNEVAFFVAFAYCISLFHLEDKIFCYLKELHV